MKLETSGIPRRIVLAGAGHAHLHILEQWQRSPIDGAQLTLVSAFDRAAYSGMLPGTLSGQYAPDEMFINLPALCRSARVHLVVARAESLDPRARLLGMSNGTFLEFDVASIGIGSVPTLGPSEGPLPSVVEIKPMQTFVARLDEQLLRIESSHRGRGGNASELPRIAVLGGGAAGFEIACCLVPHLERCGASARVVIVEAGATVLPGYRPPTIRRAAQHLAARGIKVLTDWSAERITPDGDGATLHRDNGATLHASLVIVATRAAAPPELNGFDLPKIDGGFLAVRDTLQSTADVPVLINGDTASFVDQKVPKAGVYAVRQGPILWKNIQNLLAGKPLVPFVPQRSFLSLLNTGDGRALGEYHGLAWHSRLVWRLKDHIDRGFVQRYQIA